LAYTFKTFHEFIKEQNIMNMLALYWSSSCRYSIYTWTLSISNL